MRASLFALLLVACGGDDTGQSTDAAIDSSAGLATTCTGACQTTALTAMMSSTRVLDHAYFGVNASDGTLRVEAYKGGATGCPTMSSPTPDYALVLSKVDRPSSPTPSTSPGNILDYQGDLLGGPLGAQAMMVTLTPVAVMGDAAVAFDAMLTFAAGTVSGHFYATHCTSLDG